ncbi:MAG: hypothetical protein HQL58_12795 [Magnetococcales bacterium]|nr:hypothetical protein [Magnetococcales bacterium]
MTKLMMAVVIVIFVVIDHAGATSPDVTSSDECLSCHQQRDAALVDSWAKSRHAAVDVGCPSCHGIDHQGAMAKRARHNDACINCHQRESSSYSLSKHGVIVTLEAQKLDFSLPLKEGHLRAPTCAYCHMHDKEHHAGSGVFPITPIGRHAATDDDIRSEKRAEPCRDCHSPRFVETWFNSGDRMVEIGRMKIREAAQILATIPPQREQQGQQLFQQMTEQHLRNLFLGVGHQSPDDQWWHGHPALDGDLLRIKSLLLLAIP